MARYCSDCAAETVEDAQFCPQCGRPLLAPQQERVAHDVGASKVDGEAPADDCAGSNVTGQGTPGAAEPTTADSTPTQVLWSGSYGYRALLPAWILVVLLTLAMGVISMPFVGLWKSLFIVFVTAVLSMGGVGLYTAYRRLSVRYELTNHRFVHHSGLLRRRTDRFDLTAIDDVAFGQGLIERWLGVGTIKLISNDPSQAELLLPAIGNVKDVATTINNAVQSERRRRGLSIDLV